MIQWLNGGHVDALAENGDGLLHAAAAGGRLLVANPDPNPNPNPDPNPNPNPNQVACPLPASAALFVAHDYVVEALLGPGTEPNAAAFHMPVTLTLTPSLTLTSNP